MSTTPQFAGLAVVEEGAAGSGSGVGPFTPQFAGLAVIQITDPGDWAGTPQFAGLAVLEEGPSPTKAPFTSQLLAQVVWGQNVREQLDVRSWGFEMDGHVFVLYSLGAQGTFVYDDLTGRWSRWYTQGFGNEFNAEKGIYWYDGRYVAASIQDPTVVEMDFDSQFDDGFRTIQRLVTGLITLKHRDQTLDVGALHIDASTGASSLVEPNPPGPQMKMRFSDDEGQTWSDIESVAFEQGNYQQDIQFRSLGTIFAPGRLFEISDEGGTVRIDGAWIDTFGDDNG